MTGDAALTAALVAALEPVLDLGRVEIEGLHRLSGGASRDTWAFDALLPAGSAASGESSPLRHPLILQRSRPGLTMGGPSMRLEDILLEVAARAGVPVAPVVVDVATAAPLLGEARVSRRVEGETLGPRIVRDQLYADARAVLVGQCGRTLAAIHSIDPVEVTGLELVDTLGRLRDGLDLVGEARPAFEFALRWLGAHRPQAGPLSVVHGDFRLGNLIVDGHGLRAVLDWELAHLGDPLEDLGWLCIRAWRFGGAGEVGGVGPLSDLLDAYGRARGISVDLAAVHWWIVAGTLTWGLICAVQARRHLDGHVRSVELATIGRRVCETEYDLLQLLAVPAPTRRSADPVDAPSGDDGPTDPIDDGGPLVSAREALDDPGLHGRPTAAELVDAVRGHLGDAVAPELSGAPAFHLKVAGNALAIVERELRLGPAIDAAQSARLDALGFADEAALAAAIRTGELDGRADIATAMRAAVVDRVRVANPRWLETPDRA